MRRELLASKKKETGLSLDPRTKLALLITIALFVLSGGGGAASKQFAPILAAVPLILLLTEKFGRDFPDVVNNVKLNCKVPLVVEIPDRHGTGRRSDFITAYVNEAIGIKL